MSLQMNIPTSKWLISIYTVYAHLQGGYVMFAFPFVTRLNKHFTQCIYSHDIYIHDQHIIRNRLGMSVRLL